MSEQVTPSDPDARGWPPEGMTIPGQRRESSGSASASTRRSTRPATHLIESAAEMDAIAQDVLGSSRECLSTLPGGPYPLDFLRSSWAEDIALLERGVRCCVLYQADAVRRPEVLRYLSELTSHGAQIRVVQRISYRMLVVDRRFALVGVEEDKLEMPYLVIREPALVNNLHSQFQLQWKGAHAIGIGPEDTLANDIVGEVIHALMSGVTDEVAARQLNISLRTMRRRVAAVMDMLGASSRFEAGIKAAMFGWV